MSALRTRRGSTRIPLRPVTALLLAAVCWLTAGISTAGHRAPMCRTPGQVVSRYDGWVKLVAPVFPVGANTIEHFAAAGHSLWISNGYAVMRSVDQACSWQKMLVPSAADPAVAYGPPRITSLSVVAAGEQQAVAVAVVDTPTGEALPVALPVSPTVRSRTLHSNDSGTTWTQGGEGLPPGATVSSISVSPHDTDHLAATVEGGVAPGPQVLVSADAGATWQPTATTVTPVAVDAVAHDVTDESVLWAWGEAGLLRSDDRGQQFVAVAGVAGALTAFTQRPGSRQRMAFTAGNAWSSADAGRSWHPGVSLRNVVAAAMGSRTGSLITASSDEVTLTASGGKPQRVTPVGGERARFVAIADKGDDSTVYAAVRGGIFRGAPTSQLGKNQPPPPPVVPPIPPIYLHDRQAAQIDAPTITVDDPSHRLLVGQTKRVRVSVALPATPTPLDVYFLVDTTPSMDEEIVELRNQLGRIVNTLESQRIDAKFGVGAFREYPNAPEAAPGGGNYAYRRVREVGDVDENLEMALFELRTGGGTTDNRVSALAALYQAATGAGQSIGGAGDADPYAIPAGQDAQFRPGALRVILHASDSGIRAAKPGYSGPTLDAVANALAAHRILQLGLVTGPPLQAGTPGPDAEMIELARRTDALAPADIDCDGDGAADLPKDEPLVCYLGGAGIDDAILGLLAGVRDHASVRLDVAGDDRIVRALSPLTIDSVNLKRASRLGFDLELACPVELGAGRHSLTLSAQSRGAALVGTTVALTCALPPAIIPAPTAELPPGTRPAAAVAIVGPIPPPAPITNPNPNPMPNTNLQPVAQANVNPQVGVGSQEEEQPQLAIAHADEPGEQVELAMSDRRSTSPLAVTLAGCALATAAAVSHRSRERNRFACQRI